MMRIRPFAIGLTLLVCAAAFAQTKTSDTSNNQQAVGQSTTTARETGSGMATGKQAVSGTNHLEQNNVVHRDLAARNASEAADGQVKAPRDVATGQASGKRQHKPVTATESGTGLATGKKKSSMSNAQSNPMYKDDGKSGTNPLYEGNDKRVQSGLNTAAGAVANGAAVVKTKTKSNQSNDRVTAPAQPAPPQSKNQ